jgi:ribonucleoside-triphosphate reductase
MLKLSGPQLEGKIKFVADYMSEGNAASASRFDANANVTCKNLATLEAELNKDITIQVNRELICRKIRELFDEETADEYLRQIKNHEIYIHDETSLKPYCASVSLYPFLLQGLTRLGGESGPPQHLDSFCGTFINLVFALSSHFAGAIATVEFLMYFDYFATKDLGPDYLEENPVLIRNKFEQIVYSLNQPASARGYQSVFWNISIYDRYYFAHMFGNFYFPDGTQPDWDSVEKLQRFFMKWLNQERCRAVLTFPVVTSAMLIDGQDALDEDFASFCAQELSEGNAFFIYTSPNADSLSSCCRLRNEISDHSFSYTLGAGGVSTGSINVITLNMNRMVQDGRDLGMEVRKIHKYHMAHDALIRDYAQAGMLPVYDAGYISLSKQYLTIGLNGLLEAAESQGLTPGRNQEYMDFISQHLKIIYDENRRASVLYGRMFNTELVPAENLGVKNARWDREDGYFVPRDCYNSYLYTVESDRINAIDKFVLHGQHTCTYLDGGSALHLNLEEYLSAPQYRNLIRVAARTGCNYFCTNVLITLCNSCGHMDKRSRKSCVRCGSPDVDHATRVIGYLKRVKNFSKARQEEHARRNYGRVPERVALPADSVATRVAQEALA